MKRFTIDLPDDLAARLEAAIESERSTRPGISRAVVVRTALAAFVAGRPSLQPVATFAPSHRTRVRRAVA